MNSNSESSNTANVEQLTKTMEELNRQLDDLSFEQGKTKINSDTTSLRSFSSDNSDNISDSENLNYYYRRPVMVNLIILIIIRNIISSTTQVQCTENGPTVTSINAQI